MNNVDEQYLNLLRDILDNGQTKKDRTGVGTISVFGRQMRFNMKDGFPLLTTKKIFTKAMIYELLWFLKGGDNIKYLVDNGVNIWNEWPHKRYMSAAMQNSNTLPALTLNEFVDKIKSDEEFAKKWGDLGPVYGKQWVDWKKYIDVDGEIDYTSINQMQQIIDDLKKNPDSRRIMATAWNPGELDKQLLPPCHYAFQYWTRELKSQERVDLFNKKINQTTEMSKLTLPPLSETLEFHNIPKRAISMMFQMRSVDCLLGMPFDIASYGLQLAMVGHCVNMVPEDLIITTGDTHIYLNHLEQVNEQITRDSFELPKLWLNPEVKNIFDFKYEDIKILDYKSHSAIKAPVAV